MTRVCIVTPDLAGPTRNGGIGTHCLHLARFLAREGRRVTILHTGQPDDPDREAWRRWYQRECHAALEFLDELDVEPHEPVVLGSGRHTIAHRIYRWLRIREFDAVFFQDWHGNGAIALRAKQTGCAFRDTMLSVTTHGPDEWIREGMGEFPSRGRETLIDDALERSAVELADRLICPTNHMWSWLQARGWALSGDVVVAPLLHEGTAAAQHDGSLQAGKLREIVFFGRLETRKGLLPFIDALDELARTDQLADVGITFLGRHHETTRGSSHEVIRQLRAQHGERLSIRVIPNFDQREALAHLKDRDDVLAVVPSLADNSPYTVIECITHGIPLLASNRGGIPELIGSEAHLIEPEARAMAECLRSVRKNGLEPLRPRYSTAAAQDAWRAIIERPLPRAPSGPPPAISVVIPHFEQPSTLAATLKALDQQSRPPAEVIVADDGSASSETVAELAGLEREYGDRGWRFIRLEHRGPAAARNSGAAAASGDVLVFVDADNVPSAAMLESLGEALARCGADIVTCAFHAVRGTGFDEEPDYLYCPLGAYLPLALVENSVGDTNFLVRRSVFESCGGFDACNHSASEDWQFLLTALTAGRSLAVVPEPLFKYRLATDSHARRHSELEAARAALSACAAAGNMPLVSLALAARGAFFELSQSVGRREAVAHRLKILQTELENQATQYRRVREENEIRHAKDLDDLRRTISSLEHQLRVTETTSGSKIAYQERKIRTMQRSFSWQVTAPLRALRRRFIDPRKRAREGAEEKAHAAETTPAPDGEETAADSTALPTLSHAFKFSIDSPSIWHDLRTRRFPVRGWILRTDRRPVEGVRVRCRSEIYEAAIGRRRSDVFAIAPDHPYASTAGFEVTVRASGNKGEFMFEARTGNGPWECFHHVAWTTTREAQENPPDSYEAWMRANEDFSVSGLERLRQTTRQWPRRPLISVLMPVFNTPARWLISAIESVRAQAYEDWELCIADDASTAMHVRPLLQEYARIDPRIRVVFREENGHIAAASNSALTEATGEWTVLFDHDDELAPHALAEVAKAILAHPNAGMIYSDEDKINEQGHRYAPYFKPDWMPDLLLGQNYVSHLVAYPTAYLRELRGFRSGFEGSQDWDLALRATERLSADRIIHLPKILYHWRAIPGSTAVQVAEKDYAAESSERAIAEHLQRTGQKAEVVKVPGLHWRIRRPLPDPAPKVAIVVPTRDMLDVLRPCVESLLERTNYPNFEIVVVDNQSQEPATRRWFEAIQRSAGRHAVRVLSHPHPFNYSAINNFAASQTQSEVVAFLNNDLEVIQDNWLEEMVAHAMRPEVGCVGAMLYYPDGTVQHAGVVLGVGGVASHAFLRYVRGADGYFNRMRLVQNYSAVTGACLLLRREVFEKLNGFDAENLTIAFNDVDLCLRARQAGYVNVWTPYAELVHHESASRGLDDTPEKSQRFAREIEYMRRTWGRELDNDPAYNPHLSLDYPDFSIATPPRMFAG